MLARFSMLTLPPRIPANRPHTAHPLTIIHTLNNDTKKHGTHRAKPTDRDMQSERLQYCSIYSNVVWKFNRQYTHWS